MRVRPPAAISSANECDWPLIASRTSGLDRTFVSALLNAGLCTIASVRSSVIRLSSASDTSRSSRGLASTCSASCSAWSASLVRSASARSSASATMRSTT